jgi:hypothetical protein
LIACIIEVYVDDIVVKSKKTGDLVPDLTEVFAKLRQHGVKLNPEKCIFGGFEGHAPWLCRVGTRHRG